MQPDETAPARSPEHAWMEAITPGRLALFIALLLFALYSSVILGTHSFFYQDYGEFTYPVARYTHESFWRGEVPLWNPLINCGVPFLAQWNTSICYPPILFHVLLPLPWSLNIFQLAHLILAGVGMYLLARRWTQNPLAASIAGLAFGLNGLALNCLLWTSNLAALSWQPWVILAVERAWHQGGGRRIALAALAGAMQMLAGAPEIILFTWLLLLALWILEFPFRRLPVLPSLRRFAVIVALVAGLAAVQLLPFLDLLAHSDRNASFGESDAWPLPIWGWANLIVPQFRATQSLLDTYHLAEQYWTKAYYVGLGVLALALVAIFCVRQRRVGLLAGAGLIGFVLAMGNGGYVYAWLKQIAPVIGFARYPIKYIALPVFVVPLIAAFGFHALQNASANRIKCNTRTLVVVGFVLLALAAGVLFVANRHPRPEEVWQVTRNDGVMRMLLLVGVIGCVVSYLRANQSRTRALLGLAVVALVGADLILAGQRLHPTVDKRAFGPLEINMSGRPKLGESRALVSQEAKAFISRVGMTNLVAYYVTLRGALSLNNNLVEKIPKVDGFSSLTLKHTSQVMPAITDTNAMTSPLADFLGVACMTAPRNVFAWTNRSNAMPWITVGQRPIFCDDAEALQTVVSKNFNPRQVVLVPVSARGLVSTNARADANVINPQWSAHRVRFAVKSSAPTMAVIAQSFYHNWRAFVDGQPAQLWRANYAFQALEVPAGSHEVTLVYRDRAFYVGAIVSALSLAITFVLLFRQRPSGEASGKKSITAAPLS